MVKQFVTAVAEAIEAEDGDEVGLVEFEIDGRLIKAHRPEPAQVAVLASTTGRHTSQGTALGGGINFLLALLEDNDASYISERLLDRRDPFSIEEVVDIVQYLVEEWTGNPSKSSSASTPSRRSGGQKSRQPSGASTS